MEATSKITAQEIINNLTGMDLEDLTVIMDHIKAEIAAQLPGKIAAAKAQAAMLEALGKVTGAAPAAKRVYVRRVVDENGQPIPARPRGRPRKNTPAANDAVTPAAIAAE